MGAKIGKMPEKRGPKKGTLHLPPLPGLDISIHHGNFLTWMRPESFREAYICHYVSTESYFISLAAVRVSSSNL